MLTKSRRIFKTTIQHFTRNMSHSVAAVVVMSLTLLLITIFVLMILGLNVVLDHFEAKPQVTAFFKDEATEAQIMVIKERLMQTGEVSDVTYVSKEDALARYKEQNKDEPILLEMVTAKILPASLEISATDIVYLGHLATMLEEEGLVEDVFYQQDVVETLQGWTNTIRLGGILVVGVFIGISVLIVIITISSNIASRKEEIEIMRLVGATASYIRWPFILEGILYGLVSGAFALGIIYLGLPHLMPRISDFMAGIPLFPVPKVIFLQILGGDCLLGMFMGVMGSTIAIYRGLKK
jgi:cell division transport system permease protein